MNGARSLLFVLFPPNSVCIYVVHEFCDDAIFPLILGSTGRPVHELQRCAEGHEGARGLPAGRVRRRCRQWDAAHFHRSKNSGRAVLRRVSLARGLHPEELLFRGLHPL
jgi:hypothetical protein